MPDPAVLGPSLQLHYLQSAAPGSTSWPSPSSEMLRRNELMKRHLQEKSEEAHRMFDELTKDAPKLESGYPAQPYAREAEEVVFATLIESHE